MTLAAYPTRYQVDPDNPAKGIYHSKPGGLYEPIKLGSDGWRAYSLQTALAVSPDGTFGSLTDRALRQWQKDHGLTGDGVAGPLTQRTILELAGIRADRNNDLPEGVGFGFAHSEGAEVLAATNWSVIGGVDCGAAQWRCLGPPFDLAALRFAFTPRTALDAACGRLKAKQVDIVGSSRWWRHRPHVALRAAVLHHNWPQGSAEIVASRSYDVPWYRRVSRPDDPATWVKGYTRSGWCAEYASRILQYVAS